MTFSDTSKYMIDAIYGVGVKQSVGNTVKV